MLESITPLGERGRGSRWGVTVAFFVAGAVAAGLAIGTTLGLAGRVIGLGHLSEGTRLVVLALLSAVGGPMDAGRAGLVLPTVHRQVNEQWLFQYRGWYYGLGFGFQLGLGVATIVTTSAVYLALLFALLSAWPMGGALVGAAFGLARAGTVLASANVDSPARLADLGRALERWDVSSRRATRLALLGVALTAGAFATV
jgi:hypothetical protein